MVTAAAIHAPNTAMAKPLSTVVNVNGLGALMRGKKQNQEKTGMNTAS